MTKRILAVVMALVLSLSLLSVNVFAAFDAKLDYDSSAKKLTLTWTAESGAASYTAVIYNSSNSVVKQTTVNSTGTLSLEYANPAGGSYYAKVTAYSGNNGTGREISNNLTGDKYVPSTSTSGGVTVTGDTSGKVTVSFTGRSGVVNYYMTYTYIKDNKTTNGSKALSSNTTKFEDTLDVSYADLRSISIYIGTADDHDSAAAFSWSNTGSTQSGGTGNVNLSGNTLYWSPAATGYYTGYYVINGTRYNLFNTTSNYNYTNATTADVTNIINYCKTYNVASVTFEIYVYGTNTLIGTYTYSIYNTPSYGYGIYVVPNANGTVDVSWASYSNATAYYVEYTVNGTTKGETIINTNYSFSYYRGYPASVIVYAASGSQLIATIGQASIDASGRVTYSGQQTTPSNPSAPSTSGNVVTGYNCYMTVGATSSTLQFTTNIPGPYSVLVVPVGESARSPETINTSIFTVPFGADKSFIVYVFSISTNERVAEASWTSTNTNPTNAKTEVKGLTVAQKGSGTTISWNAVSGASTYDVELASLGASSVINTYYTKNTSYDLTNFGKNNSFEVYVWAWVNSRRVAVGSFVHVAGDDYPAADDKKEDDKKTEETKPADTTPAYVTNFKGAVGTSGSITLSWDAASGKPTYEIYYKKTGTTTWKKLYSTTARSLKVNKLTNGTSYDFKVMANGNDSGVLSMTIGTTSSTKTAPDPGETTSNIPSIIATSGGNDTLTVSWNAVKNGTTYRVYIAEDGTTTYKTKTSAWSTSGTSLTLTGLEAGTYKVRIKASTDNGKTWTNLSDCDYRTVTVK